MIRHCHCIPFVPFLNVLEIISLFYSKCRTKEQIRNVISVFVLSIVRYLNLFPILLQRMAAPTLSDRGFHPTSPVLLPWKHFSHSTCDSFILLNTFRLFSSSPAFLLGESTHHSLFLLLLLLSNPFSPPLPLCTQCQLPFSSTVL